MSSVLQPEMVVSMTHLSDSSHKNVLLSFGKSCFLNQEQQIITNLEVF